MYSVHDTRLMTGGFPHSEIFGSKVVCHLPEAYRRLLRLSSPPDAKASTLCPSLLTNALAVLSGELTLRPGSTEPASSSIQYAAPTFVRAEFQSPTVPKSPKGQAQTDENRWGKPHRSGRPGR